MKKRRLFVWFLLVMMLLSGCKAKSSTTNGEETPVASETPVAVAPEDKDKAEIESFFQTYVNTNQRPIGIMVDNDNRDARPHAGLDEAYLVYEVTVEGGATRFLSFFRGVDTAKIGPVRSSRHYFLDYVMENNAIYTHYGWSPRASQEISSFGINNINGVVGTDGNIFWREEKYKGDWHSAYTSIQKIKETATSKGYVQETDRKNGIQYAEAYFDLPGDKVANTIDLNYSSFYQTGYRYNADKKLYEKTIHGQPHALQNGETLSVKNVIVQLIHDTSLGDGSDRREIITTGSGKGYYFTNGAYEEITWSKSSRSGDTTYKKADGTPLLINPGKTMVNIISPTANIVIQ